MNSIAAKRLAFCAWFVALLMSLGPAVYAAETPQEASYGELVTQLPAAGYRAKGRIVAKILALNAPGSVELFSAFLDKRLHALKGRVLIASDGPPTLFHDALSGEVVEISRDESPKLIRTNNRLRKALKGALAQLALNNPDAKVREQAVAEMLRTVDESTIAALRQRKQVEDNRRVARAIEVGLAMVDLESPDAAKRLAAVKQLDGELSIEIYSRVKALGEVDGDGEFVEADGDVRLAARRVASRMELWRDLYSGLETLFFGLSLGSVLVLAAIGLAITFGVMGVINMAHGELIMLGAYTAYVMQLLLPDNTTAALLLSVPAAFVVAGLAGVAIERTIVRFLYGRPLETLLATFGLSLILQQTVRSIFSPLNRSVATPEFMSGSWVINDALSLTLNRLYIIAFALIVFGLLMLILKRTSLGLKVRAVSQNRAMARALGVRADWVDAATFGLGAGIAGVAGVALSQLTNVGPNLGQAYIIDSFMVVVFGGVGNLWGTLIGGMSLGVVNKLLEPVSGAVMAKILVLVFLILFIQRRPGGLFPQSGRGADGH